MGQDARVPGPSQKLIFFLTMKTLLLILKAREPRVWKPGTGGEEPGDPTVEEEQEADEGDDVAFVGADIDDDVGVALQQRRRRRSHRCVY